MMTRYSIKPPDMSRNMALAGKTVSSRGMNITYNEDGYAVRATNYNHKIFAQTEKSVRAVSVDAVLNADARASYDGSVYDKEHFSDKEIAMVMNLRDQIASGEISEQTAAQIVEQVRNRYGYSGGASGNEYIALKYTKQPGEVLAEERQQRASASQTFTRGTAQASDLALQDAYLDKLLHQQQQQAIQHELEAQRMNELAQSEKERTTDALLRMMDDEDEKA